MTGIDSYDSVVLKRINDRSFDETFKYKGKMKAVNRMTISPDGNALTIERHNSNGFSGKDVAERK